MMTCPKNPCPSHPCPPSAGRLPIRAPARPANPARPAFTLVEMLVVITIIAILASLITMAAANVMNSAKNARIKVEVDNLSQSIEAFKQKYGAYPPSYLVITSDDFTNPTALAFNAPLRQFVAKAWPRYNQTPPLANGTPDYSRLSRELGQCGVDTVHFRPDCALVFWLSGFSADVTNPFLGPGGPGDQLNAPKAPLFDFDKTRLWPPPVPASPSSPTTPPQPQVGYAYPGGQVYYPTLGGSIAFPTPVGAAIPPPPIPAYVYFDSQAYYLPGSNNSLPNFADGGSTGVVMPYWNDSNGNGAPDATSENWANPTSFQIISAGQDKQYGALSSASGATTTFRLYPTGNTYDPSDNDNVTNFLAGKSTLEEAKP